MKQTASILLLALLLYNAFGYYVLFAYEREQARVLLLQDIPESDFQILHIKAALYTSVANTDFEYVNEALTVATKTYRIVKKRIQNDTISYYYLRDFRQEMLRNNLNEIIENQTITHNNESHGKPIKQLLKSFLKDYIPNNTIAFIPPLPAKSIASNAIPIASAWQLVTTYLPDLSPPPEFI